MAPPGEAYSTPTEPLARLGGRGGIKGEVGEGRSPTF